MSPVDQIRTVGSPRLVQGLDQWERIDLPTHRRLHGPRGSYSAGELAALAESVDLRGRGGAAFPFAEKVGAVSDAARDRDTATVVLVNGAEGEPASGKDRLLLTRTPHLVLDGAVLAARALGAKELVVGLTDEGATARSVKRAISEAGLRDFARVVCLPERFITGEGGALVRGVNGELAIPPGQKVRAAHSGVGGLPTLLSNAETFAQLAKLASLGTAGYATLGTPEEPGTVLLTVTLPDRSRTVVETPSGTPLNVVLGECGTGLGQGVLVGGYHGVWLTPATAAAVDLTRASLLAAEASLGAGVLLPLEEGVCPLGEVARVARHLAAESAGQCGPCRLGLPAIGDAFSAFAAGRAGHDALAKVKEGGAIVRGRGACHHPDGTTRFLLSALEVFEEDVAAHLARGTCGRPVRDVLPLPGDDLVEQASGVRLSVDWSRCAGHGLCGRLAPELITLDMFGYPLIDEGPIATRLLRAASQTAEMCPSLALGLKRA